MATSERKRLQEELAGYLRDKDRAQLRLLRARINAARVERRGMVHGARMQCREAREALRDAQKLERDAITQRQRLERVEERSACAVGKSRARARGLEQEATARGQYGEARTLARQVRNADKRNVVQRSTKRERSQEDDDAVRSNLPAELVPVFDQVAKRIKGNAKRSRTEAFLEWAEENPDEILAVQQAEADAALRALLKEQREHGRTMRKAGRYKQSPEELRQLLAGVPF
jgi:hypothetical protein